MDKIHTHMHTYILVCFIYIIFIYILVLYIYIYIYTYIYSLLWWLNGKESVGDSSSIWGGENTLEKEMGTYSSFLA